MNDPQHHHYEHTLDHVLVGILVTLFVIAGAGKIFSFAPISDQFLAWGFATWTMNLIGLGEIVGAALLLSRRTAVVGAGMLGVIMVGAIAVHLGDSRPLIALIPATSLVTLLVLAVRAHRPESWVLVHDVPSPAGQTTTRLSTTD